MSWEDPVLWLVNGTTRACIGLGKIAGDGIYALFIGITKKTNKGKPRGEVTAHSGKTDEAEEQRVAGCGQVVTEYAEALGLIARESISRDELEQLIDSGITPEDLAREIHNRIDQHPGIVLGRHHYGSGSIEIKQPMSIRERHTYIIGKSGSGKTNLIRNMIHQDLLMGNGIGVLAPELELLTEGILPYIPEHRIDDVVFVNPNDSDHPVPFNPLHLDEFEDIDRKVSDTMTIFKRVMGESGVRMDEILRNSLKALMQRPGSTLLDIEKLLSRENPSLRDEIIQTTDERTAIFFRDTYPSYGRDAHLPVIHHISPLVSQKAVRSLVCQPGESFDIRQAMDQGKILLFNLSDGLLGEQASQILGQLIVSKIQMAVMSRADTEAKERRPFYLYLDEFQTFTGKAGNSYANILSRARKYKFGIILAHQQTGQIDADLLRNILGNVSTILTFSVSSEDARRLAREYEGEQPIPPQEFIQLPTGQAMGKIDRTVFPLRTFLASQKPNYGRAKEVIIRSRQNYGAGNFRPEQPPPPDTKGLGPKLPDADEPPFDPSKVF